MKPHLPLAVAAQAPSISATPNDHDKRVWLIATGVAGGAAALATAVPFVASFAPSERVKATGGPVEVDLSDIAPGGTKTVEWRGKPVWVVRRTPEMVAALKGHDGELVDPQSLRDQQPGACSRTSRHRPTSKCRPTALQATRVSSSAKTPPLRDPAA
jgi:ubiquinol-cytochrome c reductase iron-sulfur subunit